MAEATEGAGEHGDLLAGAIPDAQSSDSSPDKTDVAAASSAVEGGKQPSQLDAVMAALGDRAEASPAEETAGQDKDTSKPEGAAEDAEQPVDGEDAKLPFSSHPRFKQLLARDKERRQLKAEIEPMRTRVTELEPKAKHFDALTNYAKQAGFTQDDFTNLLHLGRLMKNDPIAFHKAFAPHWSEIETMVGERLPADLQQKVEAGTIDEETARELARKRGEAALAGGRVERMTAQSAQERQEADRQAAERQTTELISSLQASANAWEAQWKSSDPDYAKKQPLVQERIELALYKSPPKTVDEAVSLFNKARKDVEAQIGQLLPARQSIRPMNSGTSVQTQGAPKNELDAAMIGLENMGRR